MTGRWRDKSWSVVIVSDQDQFPVNNGPLGCDAQRKVFTMSVELKPDWSYEFGLNAEKYQGFVSEDGVPLIPVVVRFKTRKSS